MSISTEIQSKAMSLVGNNLTPAVLILGKEQVMELLDEIHRPGGAVIELSPRLPVHLGQYSGMEVIYSPDCDGVIVLPEKREIQRWPVAGNIYPWERGPNEW